jgi:hypothetical protein
MEAVLYAAANGVLVLVPACFRPCQALEQAHGHLQACGRTVVGDAPGTPLWRRILSDFDRCGYALIGTADADQLFGSEAFWGFSDRRRTPREVQMSYAQLRQRMVQWSRLAPGEATTA